MYNGNISETYWKTNNDNVQRMYGYAYDGLNRLTEAVSKNVDANITGAYNEVLTYDKNGNIQTLTRTGTEENELYNTSIDNLKYFYNTDNKNLLEKVVDLTHNPEGFKDDASAITVEDDTEDDYQYDNYGNMVSDQNKGITSITYNHLNLPKIITFEDGNSITYTYDAAGVKLKKEVYHEQQTTTTTYLSGVQYLDGVLQFFPTAEGYVEPTETGDYQYVYNYTDHLGNNRLSYTFDSQTSSLQIREENNYYPFGLKQKGYNEQNLNPEYKYQYNGKEWQDELGLNWYDYGARNYDATIGRWYSMDPLAEQYRRWSPYNYTVNNPIRFIDPDGMGVDGHIYNLNGEEIGNDGKEDNLVYLKVTTDNTYMSEKEALIETTLSNSPIPTSTLNMTERIGITNDELNLRASLSTLKQTEAGRSNEPLDYNSWNNNKDFTEDSYAENPEAYNSHPGKNEDSGSTAAGAYQFLERYYKEADFSPKSQDKATVNNMTSASFEASKSGNGSDFKTTTQVRWTSLKHFNAESVQKLINFYRAKELTGNSNIATPVGELIKTRN